MKTRLQLIVVMGALAILGLLALSQLHLTRHKAERIQCVGNLKNLGIAFRVSDFGSRPDRPAFSALSSAADYHRTLLTMSNALTTPKVLVCPTDRSHRVEVTDWAGFAAPGARNRAISYFAGLDATETRPQMILFGDRSIEAQPPLPPFSYRSPRAVLGDLSANALAAGGSLEWTPDAMHRGAGNVALADGSVQQLTNPRLLETLRNSGDARNRIVQPGEGED